MTDSKLPYSPKEELFNTISHGIGLLLSIPALIVLIVYSCLYGTVWHTVSFSIYGISLVTLYLASTWYHGTKEEKLKKKLNVFDHSAIYVLIAGTYTPFLLVSLHGAWGWSLFGVVWGLALIGIYFELVKEKQNKVISAIAYILMGWVIVIAIKPLINNLAFGGLMWLMIGGLFYTIGAVFYTRKKMPNHHGIFHVFVLLGSMAHWIAVFCYILF
jgi:hemolysin III